MSLWKVAGALWIPTRKATLYIAPQTVPNGIDYAYGGGGHVGCTAALLTDGRHTSHTPVTASELVALYIIENADTFVLVSLSWAAAKKLRARGEYRRKKSVPYRPGGTAPLRLKIKSNAWRPWQKSRRRLHETPEVE